MQCFPWHLHLQSTKRTDLEKEQDKELRAPPKHPPSPSWAQHSPANTTSYLLAVHRGEHAGPCPPFQANLHATSQFPSNIWGAPNRHDMWRGKFITSVRGKKKQHKKPLPRQVLFYLKRAGCLQYLQQPSGRWLNALAADKVDKGVQ